MKLGISYVAFEGEELLESAIQAIKNEVDFISVIYQKVSYFGNKMHAELIPNLETLKTKDLVDRLECYTSDLNLNSRFNEVAIRNVGLRYSREAGCTHHISADVDEFYDPKQLTYVKGEMGDSDCSIVEMCNYFKETNYKIVPHQKHQVSLINKINGKYDLDAEFPVRIDLTRRYMPCEKYRIFTEEEFVVHHMSFVRKDIRRKIENAPSKHFYNVDKFVASFDNYQLGEVFKIAPDFIKRSTVLVDNIFSKKE